MNLKIDHTQAYIGCYREIRDEEHIFRSSAFEISATQKMIIVDLAEESKFGKINVGRMIRIIYPSMKIYQSHAIAEFWGF